MDKERKRGDLQVWKHNNFFFLYWCYIQERQRQPKNFDEQKQKENLSLISSLKYKIQIKYYSSN